MNEVMRFVEADPDTGCWNWAGSLDDRNRPRYGKRKAQPQRLLYEDENGEIPDGMYLLNDCENKACVKPDHHYLSTNKAGRKIKRDITALNLPAWHQYAACKDAEPDLFFHGDGTAEPFRSALTYCSACPVRTQCERWADERGFTKGVAGGKVYADT